MKKDNDNFSILKKIKKNTSADGIVQQVKQNLIKRILQACVLEQLLPHVIEGDALFVFLKQSNKTIIAKNVEHFSLGRFRINGDILIMQQEHSVIEELCILLAILYEELKHSVKLDLWETFAKEIENCLANEILTKNISHQINNQLIYDIAKVNCGSLIEYISTQFSTLEQLMFFEAWAFRGHPYHPCHKTKLGFSQNDYLKFSPEFSKDIKLMMVAVEKSMMHLEEEQGCSDYNSWFSKKFPLQWDAFCKNLDVYGLLRTDYLPFFVHPWQYEHVLINIMQSYIENKKLLLFKDITIATKASLSFRTLIAINDQMQPHIKVPVAVHTTSALRVNSPSSVENGPRFSNMLRKILLNEDYFNNSLKIAYESYGLHLNHPDKEITKHLAIIYRENPVSLISKNQTPIVVAALFEKSPVNNNFLFVEIMEKAGGDALTYAITYFDKYCQIVINAFLDLFLIYGVALEGHQQNTIAVFENYQPVFMIARDLSGLRIHEPTLKEKGFNVIYYPNAETVTNDDSEVVNKFLHTVIQYHLGEIVLLLSQHYNVSEKIFWRLVKNTIDLRFQQLRNKVNNKRWQQAYRAILQDDWQFKCLLHMRLKNQSKKYIYADLKNPLRETQ